MNDYVLLVMGGVLVLLALVCGYFILVEIAVSVRELRGGRQIAWRRATGMRGKGDTGPLRMRRADATAPELDRPVPQTIQPVRDEKVVRQLIAHFKERDTSEE